MKGIILSGGLGTRLYPLTLCQSKQLLPIYNKPMIYYPLSTLIRCGIQEILLITNKEYQSNYEKLLGNGSKFGVHISYMTQETPAGIAQSLMIAEDFISGDCCTLILGDNIFVGDRVADIVKTSFEAAKNGLAHIYVKQVKNPSSFGVADLDANQTVIRIEEKPQNPESDLAITGLYVYPQGVSEYARALVPSERGELEITDLNRIYLDNGKLKAVKLNNAVGWFDAGTPDGLLDAGNYVKKYEIDYHAMIGSPETEAVKNGWINAKELKTFIQPYKDSQYIGGLINAFDKST